MKKFLLCSSALSLIGTLSVFASDHSESTGPDQSDAEVDGAQAHGKVVHELNPHFGKLKANRPGSGSGISYHGGPLMLNGLNGGVNVYVIWYGNWSGNSAVTILTDLLQSEGGSPYYNINTTYFDRSGTHVSNAIADRLFRAVSAIFRLDRRWRQTRSGKAPIRSPAPDSSRFASTCASWLGRFRISPCQEGLRIKIGMVGEGRHIQPCINACR